MCSTDPTTPADTSDPAGSSQPSQNKEQPGTQVQAKEVTSPTDPSQPSKNKENPKTEGKAEAQGNTKKMDSPTDPSQHPQYGKQSKKKKKKKKTSPPDTSQPSQDKEQPKAQQSKTEMNPELQSLILGIATFTLLLPAVVVVISVMLCPLIGFFLQLDMRNAAWWVWAVMALIQGLHLRLLWTSVLYLSIFRRPLRPYRKLLMLLVPAAFKIECIQEQSQPSYLDLEKIPRGDDQSEMDALLASFRGRTRTTYRKMEAVYREERIRCESVNSEDSMRLCHIVPFMWEHKQEHCRTIGKSMAVVFLKRFMVVVMSADGVLDLYYDENNVPCGVRLVYLNGNVFNAFMYFCTKPRAGIWYHGVMSDMVRAMKLDSVRYINAGHNLQKTKWGAGFAAMELDDPRLSDIYPVALSRAFPKDTMSPGIWQGAPSGNSSSSSNNSNNNNK